MSAHQLPTRRACGWRVLVVDADRELVDRVLSNARRCEREVAAVRVAGACAEAITVARELRPDLLLIDPDLPDADGIQALATILADTPCDAIIVTRRTDPEEIARAIACGARGYILKPITAWTALPQRGGCVVSAVDLVSDLLAPAPLGPQDGSRVRGR